MFPAPNPPFINPPWPKRPFPSGDHPLPGGVTFIHDALASPANAGRLIGHSVVLPFNYDAPENAHRRWPVVFFLHGKTGTENADFEQTRFYTVPALTGTLPSVIFVFPNGMNEWYADRADGSLAIESHIINELVPFIDATYRTKPGSRSLIGFSMGGYGAVRFRLRYPELFTHALSIDGAILAPNIPRADTLEVFGSREAQEKNSGARLLDDFIDRHAGLARRLNLMLVQSPESMPADGLTPSRQGTQDFIRYLASRGMPVVWHNAALLHDATLFHEKFHTEILTFQRSHLLASSR